jgi:branched-chain amino acid aminotransferase
MSMSDRDGYIWFDGKLVPWREAQVHVLTHSLHYGMGVFEGVRAYETAKGTAIFRLQDHTQRLFRSAHIFSMAMPFDQETLNRAQIDVIKANNLKTGYLRPIVFYGSEAMGISAKAIQVHVAIAAWPWGAYLGQDALDKGIRVKTSSFTRHHPNISMSKAKATGHYVNSILAIKEIAADGYDEALLLDVDGFVAEGSGENFFMISGGKIYTPDLSSALDGITRKTVFQIARDLGFEVIEKRITRDEVYCAEEAFFTGTAAEVTPIRELDRRAIGSGTRGAITQRIQERYFECVQGKRSEYEHWLTLLQ